MKLNIISLLCLISLLAPSSSQARDDGKSNTFVQNSITDTNFTTADYIIVGVGTAGAVLAKKLTDDKCTSVIAIHNGSNLSKDPLIKYSRNAIFTVLASLIGAPIPADPSVFNVPETFKNPFIRFMASVPARVPVLYIQGLTTAQPFADNRNLLWEIAIPEGGASSINAGAWCVGTNQVYAQWEAIAGPNWSVPRIREIYKELEEYHGKTPDPQFHGFDGPISIKQKRPSGLSRVFSQAIVDATGLPFVLDYNDPNTPIGASERMQLTQSGPNGVYRVSSVNAFLGKKMVNENGHGINGRRLRINFNSTALRVLWDGNRAVGVEFSQGGETKKVFAKQGVIVTAGLFSSAFLMRSGVGPSSLLESLNIPVIFDNPNVGQGLVDQPPVYLVFSTNPKDFPKHENAVFQQIAWLPAVNGNQTIREYRLSTAKLIPGISLAVFDLVQPRSRGSITLESADPFVPPIIDDGVLSNPTDLALFQSGLSVYIKNINTALQAIDPQYQLIFPDPAILDDPLLVTSFIQEIVGTNMCFQSHCRMAPLDQGGVVDSEGRVYGVQNLIVADDSIVPLCMDGSPMASAYLIAANVAKLMGF